MLYALLLPFFRDSERKPFSAEISEHEEISVRNNLDIGAINFGCGSEPKGGSSLRNLGSIEARSLGWRYAFHVWPDHRLRSLPRRVVGISAAVGCCGVQLRELADKLQSLCPQRYWPSAQRYSIVTFLPSK
jgi:hypothetical protein